MKKFVKYGLHFGVVLSVFATTTSAKTPSLGAPITPAEAAEGAKYHPELVAEFGGTYPGPQASYVEQIGRKIAFQSGMGSAPETFTVTLLNSPINNAFAIPGGYIYTTRQLVALMNNEAELAGVLGHELGHNSARHAQHRQSAARKNAIFGALGKVLGGVLGGNFGGLLAQASDYTQLLTLKYSRKQELQADELGISYLSKAGYDPNAMATVLQSLAAQNALDAQIAGRGDQSIPAWASTHPDPASRVVTARKKAGTGTGVLNRDVFLTKISGILYGDDPKQGIVDGQVFTHPDMRISFAAPQGFAMSNGTRAVSIDGQSGKAQFSAAAYNGNLNAYIASVFAALGGNGQTLTPGAVQTTTVNSTPAAFATATAATNSGNVEVAVFAYQLAPDRAVHFVGITPVGQAGTFNSMYQSFRRISVAEAGAIKPRFMNVVTVKSGDTVQSLSAKMAYDTMKMERFLTLNGMAANDPLKVGQKIKLVTR